MAGRSAESLRIFLIASALTTASGCVPESNIDQTPHKETPPPATVGVPTRQEKNPTLTPIGQGLGLPTPLPTRVATAEFSRQETIELEKKTSIVEIAENHPRLDDSDPYYPWYRWNGGKKLFEPLAIPAGTVLTIPNHNLEPPRLPEITNTEEWEHSLSAHSTSLSGSSEKRLFNIELAVERLNGVIIEPYELFSVKKTIGPTDLSGGYVMGWGYLDGEEVPMEGGGVCQVSSTLFKPALEAGMLVVERYAHEFYSDRYGPWDATISPVLDFTLRNLYEFPLEIKAEIGDDQNLNIEFRAPREIPYDQIEVGILFNRELEDGFREASVSQRITYGGRFRIREYSSFYNPRKN